MPLFLFLPCFAPGPLNGLLSSLTSVFPTLGLLYLLLCLLGVPSPWLFALLNFQLITSSMKPSLNIPFTLFHSSLKYPVIFFLVLCNFKCVLCTYLPECKLRQDRGCCVHKYIIRSMPDTSAQGTLVRRKGGREFI